MTFEDAGNLVGYVSQAGDRVWVRWYDRSVKVRPDTQPDAYLRVGQTECLNYKEAAKLVEAMTGRRPRRKGQRRASDPTYEQRLRRLRGDFKNGSPRAGARVNSYVRPETLVHPVQARIMDALNIIREKGEVKHGATSFEENAAAAWEILECHRLGIECDKEPLILVGRKKWIDGFVLALEHHGIEYERVLA